MEIRQFKSGAVAADGGTISCLVELNDGTEIYVGLDARFPQKPSQRRIFMGAGHPALPEAKLLEPGSLEESNVIRAIEEYVIRNDVASDTDQMASVLLKAINNRIDPPVRKSWLP